MSVQAPGIFYLILTALAASWFALSCSPGEESAVAGARQAEHEVDEAAGSSHREPGDGEPGDGEHGDDEHAGFVELTAEAAARADIRSAAVEARAFGAELETTGQWWRSTPIPACCSAAWSPT